MPMYFPDLKSVRQLAQDMAKYQKPKNKYKGIIPKTEKDLPRARKELGQYFRTIWHDEIQAIEVEQSATKDNYDMAIAKGLGFWNEAWIGWCADGQPIQKSR